MTRSGKTGLIATITDIHFLSVRETSTHALPRYTKYLIIDGQVCFYRLGVDPGLFKGGSQAMVECMRINYITIIHIIILNKVRSNLLNAMDA